MVAAAKAPGHSICVHASTTYGTEELLFKYFLPLVFYTIMVRNYAQAHQKYFLTAIFVAITR